MITKPLCFAGNVIAVVETIMGVIMRHRCYQHCELLEMAQLKLLCHAVRARLQQDERHLCDVKTVHIVVVADVEGLIHLPNRV